MIAVIVIVLAVLTIGIIMVRIGSSRKYDWEQKNDDNEQVKNLERK